MTTTQSKTLHLTLKKKWFDMILSGEKKEEYREIKTYWAKRFLITIRQDGTLPKSNYIFKYDTVTFKNGYASNAPEMVIEINGYKVDEGNVDWGAEPGVKYFVIPLGKILSTKNIKQ